MRRPPPPVPALPLLLLGLTGPLLGCSGSGAEQLRSVTDAHFEVGAGGKDTREDASPVAARDAGGGHDAGANRDAGRVSSPDAGAAGRDARPEQRPDAGRSEDVTAPAIDARPDRGAGERDASPPVDASGACEYGGAPGTCIELSACSALGDHTAFPGQCPGPEDIQCCIVTPSTSNNPPTPAGYMLMQQSQVTSAMTTWAVMILDAPTVYPMFSTTTMTFGTQLVLARVEWHPPDFQNSVVHRGVTLYVPV